MKILIIRNSPTIISINNYNIQEIGLAKSLIAKGNEVGIVFYTDDNYKEELFNDIKIYYVPAKKLLNHCLYNDIIYEIIDNYDIVQVSEYNQIMSYRILKRVPEKVVIYHGPYENKNTLSRINNLIFDFVYLKKYLRLNPFILSKSNLAKDFLLEKGFDRIKVVGVGLDNEKFQNQHENEKLVNIFSQNKNKKVLLSIGTIESRKNTLFLLKVLKHLKEIKDEYILYLVGQANLKYKKRCLKYIHKNKLEKNVIFIDSLNQNEIPYLYKNANCLLLASNYEIFGMVLLEAMYFNVPIISSLNGGSSYLLDKENIIEEFDVKKWAGKIRRVEASNNRIWDKSWANIVDDFISSYKEVIDNENDSEDIKHKNI